MDSFAVFPWKNIGPNVGRKIVFTPSTTTYLISRPRNPPNRVNITHTVNYNRGTCNVTCLRIVWFKDIVVK